MPEITTDINIIPELVSWPKAWEALKAGKRIRVDGRVWSLFLLLNEPRYLESQDFANINNIPISWLDREDFEVLE
jgi:hypothetical protein